MVSARRGCTPATWRRSWQRQGSWRRESDRRQKGMIRKLVRWLVRMVLSGILAGLLAYAWLTDRPSPTYPRGQFGALLLSALVLVGLAGSVVLVWRALRR